MLLVRPCHSEEFLRANNLGVEAHINRTDRQEDWSRYVPFVHGVHLPYQDLNFASFDDELRRKSMEVMKAAFDKGRQYPVDRMVMHTIGIKSIKGEIIGTYERMIDGIREFADYAAKFNIILCVENQVHYAREKYEIFGSTAAEWLQIHEDVDKPNVLLTMDSSHAATSVAEYAAQEERQKRIFDFLAKPELIGRVHWSDSVLADNTSQYNDMHLIPGEGDLPLEFHRQINNLPVVKLLEQTRPSEEVVKGLDFIKSL